VLTIAELSISFDLGGLLVGIVLGLLAFVLLAWLLPKAPPPVARYAHTIAVVIAAVIVLAFAFDIYGSATT
jgi:hypothetical protein